MGTVIILISQMEKQVQRDQTLETCCVYTASQWWRWDWDAGSLAVELPFHGCIKLLILAKSLIVLLYFLRKNSILLPFPFLEAITFIPFS